MEGGGRGPPRSRRAREREREGGRARDEFKFISDVFSFDVQPCSLLYLPPYRRRPHLRSIALVKSNRMNRLLAYGMVLTSTVAEHSPKRSSPVNFMFRSQPKLDLNLAYTERILSTSCAAGTSWFAATAGQVTSVAGSGSEAFADGTGAAASFKDLWSLDISADQTFALVSHHAQTYRSLQIRNVIFQTHFNTGCRWLQLEDPPCGPSNK